MASGSIQARLVSRYYSKDKWTVNTTVVDSQNVRLGVYGNIAHLEGWVVLKGTPANKTILSGFPKAIGECTLLAWDQYNNTCCAFYLKNSSTSLELTGAYNLDNRNGHYINMAGDYILSNNPNFNW